MQLIKFNHTTLAEIDTITLSLVNSESLIVSNYLDITSLSRKNNQTLTFTIESASAQVPFLKNESFALSLRDKVDLSATGPFDPTLTFEDKDNGQYDYKDSLPYRPRNLIQGFTELKRD